MAHGASHPEPEMRLVPRLTLIAFAVRALTQAVCAQHIPLNRDFARCYVN